MAGIATASMPLDSTPIQENKLEQMKKLQTELESTRNSVKELRREKQQIQDQERSKSINALKDLKARLMTAKTRELELLRETLTKKHETDVKTVIKQKDVEVLKLRGDLKKCQNEMQYVNEHGLSVPISARSAFDAERTKLQQEVTELREVKKRTEDMLKTMTEADNKKAWELRRTREIFEAESSKAKRDVQLEVRKLLDQIKAKERLISGLKSQLVKKEGDFSKLQMEKETIKDQLNHSREAECSEKRNHKPNHTASDPFDPGGYSPGGSSKELQLTRKIAELTAQVHKLDDQCAALGTDKAQLVKKLNEQDKKSKSFHERQKRLLEKNMELASINRSLEAKVKGITEDNSKLRSQCEQTASEVRELSERLSEATSDYSSLSCVSDDLEETRRQADQHEKTIAHLRQACEEKDRRLELMAHRKQKKRSNKQQQKVVRFLLPTGEVATGGTGLKETYFGYDEADSMDSENMSASGSSKLSSSRVSLDTNYEEDDVFDEFTREQIEQNYQLLAKEHLELQRLHSLLQVQGCSSHVDPQRENKDTSWVDEKEKLNRTIRSLRERNKGMEEAKETLSIQIHELQEQNEEFEFRTLELEETIDKLSEDSQNSVTFTGAPDLTHAGVLQMMTEEKGMMEIHVDKIKEKLQHMKCAQLKVHERVVLVQAVAVLDVADRKLKELLDTEHSLNSKIQTLEKEKEELLSEATGVSADCVLEYEENRKKLEDANLKFKQLGDEIAELKKQIEVLHYTEQVSNSRESQYRTQIEELQRKLNHSHEGKDLEIKLFQGKEDEIKETRNKLAQLEAEKEKLSEELEKTKCDNNNLSDQLQVQSDTNSLTECDKDTSTLLHNLQTKVNLYENSKAEMTEEIKSLQEEVTSLKHKLKEYERDDSDLTEQNVILKEDVEVLRSKCSTYEEEIQSLKDELNRLNVHKPNGNITNGANINNGALNNTCDTMPTSEEDIADDNSRLRSQLFGLKEQLKCKDSELEKIRKRINTETIDHVTALEKELANLQHENQTLKEKLKDKIRQVQIKEGEVEGLFESHNKLEEQLSKYSDDGSKNSKTYSKQHDHVDHAECKEQIQDLLDAKTNLEAQLGVIESKEDALKEKIKLLEEKDAESQDKLTTLATQLQGLQDNRQESAQPDEVKQQLSHFEQLRETLQDKIQELQATAAEHKSKAEENEQKVIIFQATETRHKEQIHKLNEKITKITESEHQARDQLQLVLYEKERRIDSLQDQLARMEENEVKLSETIAELEEVEETLRNKVKDFEKVDIESKDYEDQINKLKTSEQNLKDKLEQMDCNENLLRKALSEMDEKLQDVEPTGEDQVDKGKKDSSNSDKYKKKILELEERVEELTKRESELMEEIYSLKLDNQELAEHNEELQDHIEELEDKEGGSPQSGRSPRSPRSPRASKSNVHPEELTSLKDKIVQLEKDNSDLKDQLLKAKLDGIGTLRDTYDLGTIKETSEIQEGLGSVKELQDQINELEQRETEYQKQLDETDAKIMELQSAKESLLSELEERGDKIKKLEDKINILEQSEDKLMEHVDELEEQDERLRKQLDKLKREGVKGQEMEDELRARVSELQLREQDVQEHVEELEVKKLELKERLDEFHKNENKQLGDLQQKVDMLLDTEERLIDRLQEQEEVEQDMHHKLEVFEKQNTELSEKVQQLEQYEKLVKETNSDENVSKKRIEELEHIERILQAKVTDLEKTEAILNTKMDGLEINNEQLQSTENSLWDKISEYQQIETLLNNKVNELEKSEISLKTQVSSLESQNRDLLHSLQSAHENTSQTHFHISDGQTVEVSNVVEDTNGVHENTQRVSTSQNLQIPVIVKERSGTPVDLDDTKISDMSFEYDNMSQTFSSTVTNLPQLHSMTKEEMVSRIHELERMETFHRNKIRDLSENLSHFRQAVEVVAITMETDTDVPVTGFRPKTKDSQFEARLQQLVKSEVTLKLKVLELEKRNVAAQVQVRDCNAELREAEAEHKQELEELESKLLTLQKREARLKNKLQYGDHGGDGDPLAKIQHLEELVFDLEASERKLKRQILDLKQEKQNLKDRLDSGDKDHTSSSNGSSKFEFDSKDSYYDLLQEVKLLGTSERELREELNRLDQKDSTDLLKRIHELERSEKALKRKVEILETASFDTSFTDDSSAMLDTPEAILKQRIRELEKMDRHLRQQVIELERDREELHDIARKDKNMIHALNIRTRELQLSEKNLKEQINRFDIQESHLQMKIDNMTDRIEELQKTIRKLQNSERNLKGQLAKFQFSEDEISIRLQHTNEEMKVTEQRCKRRVSELEQEKHSLTEKIDELKDRIEDLERSEISMKQRLRTWESSDVSKENQIVELEKAERHGTTRIEDLEKFNESLSQKVHNLEEEKVAYMYDISELETKKAEHMREIQQLKHIVASVKEKLLDKEGQHETIEKHMQELVSKGSSLETKVQEYEDVEKELNSKVNTLGQTEAMLKEQMQRLEAQITKNKAQVEAAANIENENTFLRSQVDHNERTVATLEEQNHKLEDKLKVYEFSHANKEMATIPKSELAELRAQAEDLLDTTTALIKLEHSETNLKETVAKLREGKDACGHDMLINDLKQELNNHNKLIQKMAQLRGQAHELLKNNYEEVKAQLKSLKDGGNVLSSRLPYTSKCIQASLGLSFSLKDVTPELRNALKGLGAHYPNAYQEFVRTLYPSEKTAMQIAIAQSGPPKVRLNRPGGTPEEVIIPRQEGSQNAPRSNMTASKGDQTTTKPTRPVDAVSVEERNRLIDNLVSTLPQGKSAADEAPLWKSIENRYDSVGPLDVDESYWADLEQIGGEMDDLALSFNFDPETDDNSSHSGHAYAPEIKRSPSVQSEAMTPPPPLPASLPPPMSLRRSESPGTESYYLPSQHGDSADEADDIVDEEMPATRARSLTPGREVERSESPAVRRGRLGYKMTSSLDSIPDSGVYSERTDSARPPTTPATAGEYNSLRDRIKDMERQIKAKDKELELFRLNQRDHAKKSKESEDIPGLKAKDADLSIPYLQQQLEKKEKQLTAKNNEVDRLSQELRKWQDESLSAKDDKIAAEKALRTAEMELAQMKDTHRRYQEIQTTYSALQTEHSNLVNKHASLLNAEEDKAALEKIVLKLRGQLKDLERIDLERQDLQQKLTALEAELKEKTQSESELIKENAHLRHHNDGLVKQKNALKDMERDYTLVRSKYDEMERIKTKAQTMVTPLRAKVIRLAKKCRQKDELIQKLADEVRHSGEPSNILTEADRVTAQGASEEYNRPSSPLTLDVNTFEDLQLPEAQSATTHVPPASRIPRRVVRPLSDDTLGTGSMDNLDTLVHHQRPSNGLDSSSVHHSSQSGIVTNLSYSSDHSGLNGFADSMEEPAQAMPPLVSLQPVTQLSNGHYLTANSLPNGTSPRNWGHNGTSSSHIPVLQTDIVYRAIKDYDPSEFSRSGQQKSELPLREGDVVKVIGPKNERGYHEAEVHGRVGLVPANYLLPVYPHLNSSTLASPRRSRPDQQVPLLLDSSPEQILDMHQHMQQAHVPNHNGPPDPPGNLHVQRVIGSHGLLLSWTPPAMDELARNNGHTIKGYKIHIDNKERQMVGSPYLSKALIEKLDLRRSHQLSIQAVTADGRASRTAQTLFEDVLSERAGDNVSDRDPDNDGDMSSVLSNSQHADGEPRVFLAVYDYNPTEHSPNSFPAHELTFKTGDIVTTYGDVRTDGFYLAKAHGKKGLVPASFIEEVALIKSRGKRNSSGSSLTTPPFSPRSGSQAGSHVSHGDRPSSRNRESTQKNKMATAQV